MKKITCLCIYILYINTIIAAQDIHLSQFNEAPLLRNPSLAGIFDGDIRVQSVFRSQWNTIANAFKTVSLNGEYKLHIGSGNDFLTTGMQLFYDQAGEIAWKTMFAEPVINIHKSLSNYRNNYLSLGFMCGLVQTSIDQSKIITDTQYDGNGTGENITYPIYSNFDGSVGLSFNSQLNEIRENNFFIGLAYHHFTHPKNSFYSNNLFELTPKWVSSAGFRFAIDQDQYITIQSDYTWQGRFTELIGGATFGIKIFGYDEEQPLYRLEVGSLIRWNDAVIPCLKLNYHSYAVSLSYDVNISTLKTSSSGKGGFELGITYSCFNNTNNSTLNSMLCPRF